LELERLRLLLQEILPVFLVVTCSSAVAVALSVAMFVCLLGSAPAAREVRFLCWAARVSALSLEEILTWNQADLLARGLVALSRSSEVPLRAQVLAVLQWSNLVLL
jgi:hypothetical protein